MFHVQARAIIIQKALIKQYDFYILDVKVSIVSIFSLGEKKKLFKKQPGPA